MMMVGINLATYLLLSPDTFAELLRA